LIGDGIDERIGVILPPGHALTYLVIAYMPHCVFSTASKSTCSAKNVANGIPQK